jgi:uncharacterized protein (TIGR02996 family)
MKAGAFLQAIAQSPEDDALRLVYSDWLEENGKAERAELIRVQIELTRIGMDNLRYPELHRREMELLKEHQAAWVRDELPEGVEIEDFEENYWLTSGFRRGLPARVVTPLSAFLSVGEKLARVPIEKLHIDDRESRPSTSLPQRFAKLAGCPVLAHFPRLNLQYDDIGVQELATLLGSAHLPMLREIVLGPAELGEEGGELLAVCERLSELRCLDLGSCRIDPPGLLALLGSPHLHALKEVDLSGNNLDDEAARALADHKPMADWRVLDLSYNEFHLAGVRALLGSKHLRNLEDLDLSSIITGPGTWLGDPLVHELLRAGLPGKLRRLRLHSSDLTAYAVAFLAKDKRMRQLVELDLSINEFGSKGAQALADSPHLAGLQSLALFATELEDAGAEALASSRQLKPFRVTLGQNVIGPGGGRALAQSAFLSRVVDLDLSDNPLGDEGVAALLEAPWMPRLRELRLARTELGNAGLAALADSPALEGIVSLDLTGNRLSAKGAIALAESPHADRLRHLDLSRNTIGKPAADALRKRFGSWLVSHRKKA